MRQVLIMAFLAVIIGCETETKEDISSISPSKDSAASDISYPYTATYSSKFEMGDTKNSEIILKIWKDWDNNTLDNSKSFFADSVEMYFWDGSFQKSSRDSTIASAKAFRNNYTSVVSTVHGFMPVKAIDKNEDLVLVWGKEVHTDKNGKTDSLHLHEVWRFNKDRKVNLASQFAQKPIPLTNK